MPATITRMRSRLRRLGRDYAYVLPGLPLSVFGVSLLVAMTALSIGTLVVWVGALLLPLTLLVASAFAELSRARLSIWGRPVPSPRFHPAGVGLTGMLRRMTDARRWLDLAFEGLLALPLRLFTFVFAVTWTAVTAGGLTFWLWGRFLPLGGTQAGPAALLELVFPERVPLTADGVYLLDSLLYLALGLVMLVLLPAVMHALARLDAFFTAALLGAAQNAPRSVVSSQSPPGGPGVPAQGGAFSVTAWTWIAASFAAAVLLAVGWPVTAALYGVHPALAMLVTVVHCAAAALAVRWAWAGLGVSTLAALGIMIVTLQAAEVLPWPWPVPTLLTHFLVVLVLALKHPWYWALSAWSAGAVLTVMSSLFMPAGVPPGAVSNSVVLISVSGGVALLGALVRLWVSNAGRVEQAETFSAEEARRRREVEERNRIARELHDVVAHSMSVINVQASTAKYRKPGLDPQIQQEFDDIAESSRQALGEMRSLLGILRGHDEAPTAPMPGLEDIADLVEASRASGVAISYSGDLGGRIEVSVTAGLTAYRVVQEALSNALRHAPGSSVEVRMGLLDGEERKVQEEEEKELIVEVMNSAPEADAGTVPGSGLGLAGIRERVSSLGGSVEAGLRVDGGFLVSARIPRHDQSPHEPDHPASQSDPLPE